MNQYFLRPIVKDESLEFLKFFDAETMSVHLKENQYPLAKKGKPGTFSLTKLNDDILSRDYLELISSQILDVHQMYLIQVLLRSQRLVHQ